MEGHTKDMTSSQADPVKLEVVVCLSHTCVKKLWNDLIVFDINRVIKLLKTG